MNEVCVSCEAPVEEYARGLDKLCPGCRNGITYATRDDYAKLAGILMARGATMRKEGLVIRLPDNAARWCYARWGGKLYAREGRLTMWRLKRSVAEALLASSLIE